MEPAGSVFGPGSVLYFFADRAVTSTDYSSEVAYGLVRGSGVRMGVVSAPPVGAPVVSPSTGYASFETNRIYQPGLLEAPDIWLWDAMVSGAERTQGFTLRGWTRLPRTRRGWWCHLQGGSESGTTADHHIRLSVNGGFVGEATFAGKQPYRLDVLVPASLLREGANELAVANVGDTGVSSLVFLDRFEVSYPQASTVRAGVFEGVWAESGTAEVGGLSGSACHPEGHPSARSRRIRRQVGRWLPDDRPARFVSRRRRVIGTRWFRRRGCSCPGSGGCLSRRSRRGRTRRTTW